MLADWPLVGRSEELDFIERLARARGGPVGVVLAGAAGVGKTRLARETLTASRRRGATTRWVAATASSRRLPLGPFAMSLRGATSQDPTQLMQHAVRILTSGAGQSGVVIGVDDAHLLDDLSGLLVHHLALRGSTTVVLTLRSGETAPDAITALWKEGHLTRIEVQPLSRDETATLLEAVVGEHVDSGTVEQLWRITEGNALYLRQLVDGEREAGRLAQVAGVWRWSGHPTLSPGLVELIESRIGQLPDPLGDVVDVLALAEPLPLALLIALTGADAVEQAESRGLVETIGPDHAPAARLAHPLFGEMRRARCGRLRARRLRGEIATVLADQPSGHLLRRAVLTLDSDLRPDPELLGRAAARAVQLLDFPLSERLARAATAEGDEFAPRLTLGYALSWSDRGEEAETELARLAEGARSDAELAAATVARVGNLFWTLAISDAAEQALEHADRLVTDRAARLDLAAVRSACDAWSGRTEVAAKTATGVLADGVASGAAQALAAWSLATAHCGLGRPGDVREALRGADRTEAAMHSRPLWVRFDLMWTRALRIAGHLAEAEEALGPYLDPMLVGGPHQIGNIMRGELARDRGDVTAGAKLLRQAAAGLHGSRSRSWTFYVALAATPTLAMAGDLAGARRSLSALTTARHPHWALLEPDALLAQAWVAAAEGVVSEAVALALRAADLAAAQEQPASEVHALYTAVRFGEPSPADRLAKLAGVVEGPFAPAAAAHAAALGADDPGALHAAAGRLEALGAVLLAVDAEAHAAAACHRRGNRGSARAATARAQLLAERCPGARTPALTALTAPLPLTGRERETATLVAAGLSNREIADRLAVSVRTVEGHIYRATSKLGVTDRAQLAELLAESRGERGN